MKKRLKLFGWTSFKYAFVMLTLIVQFVLLTIDIVLYFLSIGKLELKLTERFSNACISVLKYVLKREHAIIFEDLIKAERKERERMENSFKSMREELDNMKQRIENIK